MKLNVYDMEGKQVDSVELSEAVFGMEPRKDLMHTAVVAYLRNQRQGNASTKTRAEVRGGGRKPWRQKGTGRARAGSNRSPVWKGGGVTFGPRPRNFYYHVNKKVRRLAMVSALSTRFSGNDMVCVDKFKFDNPKTKDAINFLKSVSIDTSTLVVLAGKEDNTLLSFRNIPKVTVSRVENLNVYQILKHKKFVVTKDALSKIQEVFA